jgi:hypothetical protein
MEKDMIRCTVTIVILGLVLLSPTVSQGDLMITIERASSTQVSISATGTFELDTPGEGPSGIFLIDPFATFIDGSVGLANNTLENPVSLGVLTNARASNAFHIGSPGVLIETLDLWMSEDNLAGQPLVGGADLTFLPGTNIAPVGSTGDVWYGANDGYGLETWTGTWEIVGQLTPVPVPSGLLLAGLGLGTSLIAGRKTIARKSRS